MNDQRPMLDRDSRARLGRKLSSDYNQMTDPMLPERLQELVAVLLDMKFGEHSAQIERIELGQPAHRPGSLRAN
jgi:hypothetical protein